MQDKIEPRVRILNDYRVIYVPEHPSSMTSDNWKGWVYEHIYVAEHLIGRSLTADECVHHLDLDRSNNHPSNLIVLLKSQHRKLHSWIDKGAPGIEKSSENALNSEKPKATDLTSPPANEVFAKTSKRRVRKKQDKLCLVCNKIITGEGNIKYCSITCSGEASRRSKHPSKEELEKLIWEIPTTEIAKRYNVSDKAVEKWCKKHEVTKPPRGYWAKIRAKATLKQAS